jgi:hypothetical protein
MKTFAAALAAASALAFAGSALAAFPGTYGLQGGPPLAGIQVSGAPGATTIRLGDREATIPGAYGIPTLITTQTPLGLFHDGSRFVLQNVGIDTKGSSFVVVRSADLHVEQTIRLAGSFAFDALSPSGRMLYLIEHRSSDLQHYVVRAYDLAAHRLLPGRIADKTQASWVMQGYPAARTGTANGRWVYTLYSNPGGFPFIHALDTVRGVAHCVGIAWPGSQDPLPQYRLAVRGNRLLVLRPTGGVYRSIDRTTWAVALK